MIDMTKFKKPFKYIRRKITRPFKWIRMLIKQQFGLLDVPRIVLYRGYGNNDNVFVRGMVIDDRGLKKPRRKDSILTNMKSMISRYTGDAIPGVAVSIKFNGNQLNLESDENGHFGATFPGTAISAEFHPFADAQIEEQFEDIPEKLIKTRENVLIPGQNAEFGVISDIDDTIMISHATQTLKKLRLMLLKNAITRKPFPGISAWPFRKSGKPFFLCLKQ